MAVGQIPDIAVGDKGIVEDMFPLLKTISAANPSNRGMPMIVSVNTTRLFMCERENYESRESSRINFRMIHGFIF